MITTKAKINFTNLAVPPIIPAVQGDTGRVIQFELSDFTIPSGATATYYVQKPSGEAVYNNATISGNNVLVELTAQSIIEIGENYGQVRILKDEDVVTSFDFILLVKTFRGIEAVQSETEMNIFDKAVQQAQETISSTVTDAEAAIEAAAQEAEEYIAQAIDPTLTITNKAADAKVAGDGLKGIAAAFDTQEQYFAGDYVRKDFKLYRRIADCTSVWGDGSWIAAKWQETNLGNEILQRNLIAASRYDHTRDYAVGEYCTHDRWLYRCISPVTGGSTGDIGNWDATKWEAVRIGEELTDIKEALDAVDATLPTKADKSGVVASAEQLLSDVGTEDKAPYLFRATPYDSTRVDEEVVGATVGWNQLCTPVESQTTGDITITANADGSLSFSGTHASGNVSLGNFIREANHIYLYKRNSVAGAWSLRYSDWYQTSTSYDDWRMVKATTGSTSDTFGFNIGNSGQEISGKVYFQLIDLTAWFGSTIADYAYSLEQATAGSGVAFIKALLPGGYIPYSAPTLKSVSGLSGHRMSGKNIWGGTLFRDGIKAAIPSANIDSTNKTIAFASNAEISGMLTDASGLSGNFDENTRYTVILTGYNTGASSSTTNMRVYYTDGTYDNLSFPSTATSKQTLVFVTASSKTVNYISKAYQSNSTVLYYDECGLFKGVLTEDDFEPYTPTTYALDSDLTLRGILKMDADHNVYADGDVYKSDGTVTRRFAEVDLGSLDWTAQTLSGDRTAFCTSYGTWSDAPKVSNSATANAVCTVVSRQTYQTATSWGSDVFLFSPASGTLPEGTLAFIFDDGKYADATAFKTAMDGIKFVYEKATATTETADPYASPQNCSPGGTEEYAYAEGGSGVVVGHNSRYQKNLKGELERVMVAVPKAPTNNGTYSLKATVTSSGVTYGWVAD